jgi:hypothetical protein
MAIFTDLSVLALAVWPSCRLAVWPHGPSDVYSRDAAAGVRRETPRWNPTSSLL